MRDRLIELLMSKSCKHNKCPDDVQCDDCEHLAVFDGDAEKIADAILADGWIRPPCKVGYYIWFFKNDRLAFGQVEDITISRNGLYAFVFEVDEEDEVIGEWTVPLCEFGKTVFLTKEEAEQALRKDEGK